jgi:predicted GIY-YIG superfamily endonuclease
MREVRKALGAPNANIPSTSKEAKVVLQGLLDGGSIASFAELLVYVNGCGWRLSRQGTHYLGIVHGDGKRFRVRFRFSNECLASADSALVQVSAESFHGDGTRSLNERSYLIYALIAWDQSGGNICYVGQTVNFRRRMREHLKRRRLNRASAPLFDWADKQRVIVHVVVLASFSGPQSVALQAEKFWWKLAKDAGLSMVGQSVKSALRDPIFPECWPANAVLAACRPIADVVSGGVARLPPV